MGQTGDLANFSSLASVAERLRAVKDAQRRFLRLWGIEQSMIDPMIDRVAADVEQHAGQSDGLDELGESDGSPGLYDGFDGWPPAPPLGGEPPSAGPPAGVGR